MGNIKKQYEVVAGILIYEHRILCVQRGPGKYEYTSLKFEFPGGKVEYGESKTEALVRELSEELHIRVEENKLRHFMSNYHSYPDFDLTMHSFICPLEDHSFRLEEHISYHWMEKEQLLSLDWAAADIPVVANLLEVHIDELA